MLQLCSDYITKRRFYSWLSAGSLLSTGDCVYTFWLTSRLCPELIGNQLAVYPEFIYQCCVPPAHDQEIRPSQ